MRLVETPPVRRLFVPKEGYVLWEADLKRADPQIVAREAGEESLLQVFRDNVDVYSEMGKWAYNLPRLTPEQRQWNKNGINAINYDCKAKTLAATIHTTETRAQEYIDHWLGPTGQYPGIGQWHNRVRNQLRATRTVHNVYGFRRYYTERLDGLLRQALAWIASSTVSVTINRGMKFVFGSPDGPEYDPWTGEEYTGIPSAELLLQIHDSVLGQMPVSRADELLPRIKKLMEVTIPYSTPLVIPITLKVGLRGEPWGDLETWDGGDV